MILIIGQLDNSIKQVSQEASTVKVKETTSFDKTGVEYTQDNDHNNKEQKEIESSSDSQEKDTTQISDKKEVDSKRNSYSLSENTFIQSNKDFSVRIKIRKENGSIKKEFEVDSQNQNSDEKSKEELSNTLQLLEKELKQWIDDYEQTDFPVLVNIPKTKKEDTKNDEVEAEKEEEEEEDKIFQLEEFSIFDNIFSILQDVFSFPFFRLPLRIFDAIFLIFPSSYEAEENEFEKQIKEDTKIKQSSDSNLDPNNEVIEEEIKEEKVQKQFNNDNNGDEKKKITENNNDTSFSDFNDNIELGDDIEFSDDIELIDGIEFADEIKYNDELENESSSNHKREKTLSIKRIYPTEDSFNLKKDFVNVII